MARGPHLLPLATQRQSDRQPRPAYRGGFEAIRGFHTVTLSWSAECCSHTGRLLRNSMGAFRYARVRIWWTDLRLVRLHGVGGARLRSDWYHTRAQDR